MAGFRSWGGGASGSSSDGDGTPGATGLAAARAHSTPGSNGFASARNQDS
jgi:hypothetical protein